MTWPADNAENPWKIGQKTLLFPSQKAAFRAIFVFFIQSDVRRARNFPRPSRAWVPEIRKHAPEGMDLCLKGSHNTIVTESGEFICKFAWKTIVHRM
jgi:hypothetical protein